LLRTIALCNMAYIFPGKLFRNGVAQYVTEKIAQSTSCP